MLRLFGKKSSRQIARDRLKILLMELIKNDIAKVISKYMKIDSNSMEIEISNTSSKGKLVKHPTLYANIPILDMKNG